MTEVHDAARVLFRWKQELAAAPTFARVEITDASMSAPAGYFLHENRTRRWRALTGGLITT
jgi:hypothetical protein